jgi:hypothetical protein
MKWSQVGAAVLLLGATATSARAVDSVSINWDSCTGPINKVLTGGGVADAYASLIGQSETSQGYECIVIGRPIAGGVMPDAWRFDPTGCEGSSLFTLNHLAPAAVAKTCPSLQGTQISLQIKDYSFDPTTGAVRIVIANAYPNGGAGNPAATDPTQRYFMADFHFDLTYATTGPTPPDLSTCGGLEVPVRFSIVDAIWLDLSGVERAMLFSNGSITANDPHAVPVTTTSWGAIKSQYRK